jgi:hypothetical protein
MKAMKQKHFITAACAGRSIPRLLNRVILSKSSEIEAITKRCRGIKMFCLGERDTLLVTYISGSFFFFKTHYYAEKRHQTWEGAFQKYSAIAILHA